MSEWLWIRVLSLNAKHYTHFVYLYNISIYSNNLGGFLLQSSRISDSSTSVSEPLLNLVEKLERLGFHPYSKTSSRRILTGWNLFRI